MKQKICAFGLGLFALFFAASGHAAATNSFPNKTVRIVVPYPPGGVTDTQARFVAQKLNELWGQPVIVENKPGGNTIIATSHVLNSSAEPGYNLLISSMPLILNPYMYESMPYDAKKEIAPVTLMSTVPGVVITAPQSGVNTLADLTEKAKSTNEALNFGSAGIATFTHLSGELFSELAGIDFEHIAYQGSAPAQQDLLGGRLDVMFDNGALGLISSESVTPLAVTSSERLPWLPEVPTIAEQGYPDFHAEAWFGFFVPANTPNDLIEKLSNDITRVLESEEAIDFFAQSGVLVEGGTPEKLDNYLQSEEKRWGDFVQRKNITIDQ